MANPFVSAWADGIFLTRGSVTKSLMPEVPVPDLDHRCMAPRQKAFPWPWDLLEYSFTAQNVVAMRAAAYARLRAKCLF